MPSTIWKHCQMVKLTCAQFEEGMDEGWPYEHPGTAIVQMTNALARRIRVQELPNRPLKLRNKQKILDAIQEHYWQLNGEPLILTREFAALDGRHRLDAFAEMADGDQVEVVISWGWSPDAFDTIDIGAKRSGGDVYHVAGEGQSVLLSAAARYDWRIMRKDMLSGAQLPEPLMRQYLDDNPGLRPALSWAQKVWHLIPKGMAVALFYRFAQTDVSGARQFFLELGQGENINRANYTYHLREWLGARKGSHLQLDNPEQAQVAATVINGWWATTVQQQKKSTRVPHINHLLWRQTRKDEPFPSIQRCDTPN